MHRDGARNAKAEILDRAFGFEEVQGTHSLSGGIPLFVEPEGRRLAHDGSLPASPDRLISIGLGKSGAPLGQADDEIILLCQRKSLLDHPIVERAKRISKGEIQVVYTGPIRRHARVRPMRIGCSVAHHRVTAGTLGCFVALPGGGIGLLSNNHVLANVNQARFGDVILQPGSRDGGTRPADVIGTLHTNIPIRFGPAEINYVDCAIATIDPAVQFDSHTVTDPQNGTPFATLSGHVNGGVFVGDAVHKLGRTTGLTSGSIFAIEVDNLQINMGSSTHPRIARFDNQIQICSPGRQFSKPGDSGSLIFDEQGNACALLFAGSERGGPEGFGLTSANPIAGVLDELGGTIYVS